VLAFDAGIRRCRRGGQAADLARIRHGLPNISRTVGSGNRLIGDPQGRDSRGGSLPFLNTCRPAVPRRALRGERSTPMPSTWNSNLANRDARDRK